MKLNQKYRNNRFFRPQKKGEYIALRQKDYDSAEKKGAESEMEVKNIQENAQILSQIVSLERQEVDKRSLVNTSLQSRKQKPFPKFILVENQPMKSRQNTLEGYRSAQISSRSYSTRNSARTNENLLNKRFQEMKKNIEREDHHDLDHHPVNLKNLPSQINKCSSDYEIQKPRSHFLMSQRSIENESKSRADRKDFIHNI